MGNSATVGGWILKKLYPMSSYQQLMQQTHSTEIFWGSLAHMKARCY